MEIVKKVFLSKERKHFFLKFIFVACSILGMLMAVNVASIWLEYAPSTILTYAVGGSLVSLFASIAYDRLFKGEPSDIRLEVETIKLLLLNQLDMPNEEYEAEKKIVSKYLHKKTKAEQGSKKEREDYHKDRNIFK